MATLLDWNLLSPLVQLAARPIGQSALRYEVRDASDDVRICFASGWYADVAWEMVAALQSDDNLAAIKQLSAELYVQYEKHGMPIARQPSEMRIEMCALCGKPAEVVTIRLGGGPAVPITQCECVHGMPGGPQMVMVNDSAHRLWIDEINKHEHNVTRPVVRLADLDEGDRLRLMKEVTDKVTAEVAAHFDKTYGETIERLTNENEALKDRSARFREMQADARRKERERVVLDTSMWDD